MRDVIIYFLLFALLPGVSFADTCAKKGEEAYENPFQHPQTAPRCCKGLVPMGLFAYSNGRCESLTGPSSPCMPCGDGICEYSSNENICNCPQDCKTLRRDCAAEGQKIKLRNPFKIWSLDFLPLKCCRDLLPDNKDSETALCMKQKKEALPVAEPQKEFGFWQDCKTDNDCTLVDEQPPCACGKTAINARFVDAYRSDFELQKEILKLEKGPGQYCEPCQPPHMRKPQTAKCLNLKCRSQPSHH